MSENYVSFFTGKMRKETHFLAFFLEKFLPSKENGEIFPSTEVFRRANSPFCYWRGERVQLREKDLCFLCWGLFQSRLVRSLFSQVKF
jgi:hypothetical protein